VKRPRLVMADDHTIVLEGLSKLLEPEFEVVGTAVDGRSLIATALQYCPDVVLVDISMPLLNGFQVARQLRKQLPKARIVFLTMHSDVEYVKEAFRAGASAYVLKRSAAAELVSGIHDVLHGRTYVSPSLACGLTGSLPGTSAKAKSSRELTDRQREVLQLVADGHASKEIAAILEVSIKTVEFHKSMIARKLKVQGTAALTRYAVEHRIVVPSRPQQ